jgi:integrase/recombinase XerC
MAGVDDFIAYLQNDRRYAAHTLTSYKNDLEQYHAFCLEQGKDGMDLFFKTVRTWVVHLMEQDYSPKSIHRKLSSLRSYCKYLIRRGELAEDPVERVLKPKLNKSIPQFVDEKSMNRLLDQYDFGDDFTGVRDRLIVNLLYQTGMRRSELTGLNLESVDLKQRLIRVLGKRNKERLIPFGDELKDHFAAYISKREELFMNTEESTLFLTVKGKPVYPSLVYTAVNRYLRMVSTLEKTSPHVLRHTFATHMLNNGADLNAIKEILGHANLSATQVYTHNTFEKLKSIYNQAHPRA